jgi:hypothetical protein
MNPTDIMAIRLMSQQIAASKFKSPNKLVSWMGAMQAQDYNMAKWAIGLRVPGTTVKTVEKAIDKGEIIRTHVMRPTWHFVAAEDIHWMLALTGPKIISSMKGRDKQLGLTEAVYKKSNKLLEKLLLTHKHLTRDELVTELKKAQIPVDEHRASHLLVRAELDRLICSGAHKEGLPTFTLLHAWVPEKATFHREEAWAKLAQRYFNSHSPATLQDFCWWSGATLTEGRQALEMIKKELVMEQTGSQTLYISKTFATPPPLQESAYLLPAFDEFLISYKDRTNILAVEHHQKAFSTNGIFWPLMLVNGKITGSWKRTVVKDKVIIEPTFFKRADKKTRQLIEKAADNFGHFLNRTPEVVYD